MKRLFAAVLVSTAAALALAGSASAQCAPPYCPAPSATANPATAVTDTSAALSGTVSPNGAASANWQIQVSTSATFSQGVVVVASGTTGAGGGQVSGTATGLAPNTTYSFRVQVQTAGGTTWSPVVSFTTTGTPSTNPPSGGGNGTPSGNAPVDPRRVTISADPRRDREAPFRYEISGGVQVDDGALCSAGGRVTLTFRAGGEVVRERTTALDADCGYQRSVKIRAGLLPSDAGRIRVRAAFGGSSTLNAMRSETITVRYG